MQAGFCKGDNESSLSRGAQLQSNKAVKLQLYLNKKKKNVFTSVL